MHINNTIWEEVLRILTSVDRKFDSNISFVMNESNKLRIILSKQFYKFFIDTEVKWDFETEYYSFPFTNLDIFETSFDLTETGDGCLLFDDASTQLKIKPLEEFVLPEDFVTTIGDNYLDLTESLEETISIFSKLSNTYNPDSEDFSSGVLVKNDILFSTNRINATKYTGQFNMNLENPVHFRFLKLLNAIKEIEFKSLKMFIYNTDLFIIGETSDYTITYSQKNMITYFPDVDKLFNRANYTNCFSVDREMFFDALNKITRFDSKISVIDFVINGTELVLKGKSFEKQGFIESKCYLEEPFTEEVKISTTASYLSKATNDLSGILNFFLPQHNRMPLLITDTDNVGLERYLILLAG